MKRMGKIHKEHLHVTVEPETKKAILALVKKTGKSISAVVDETLTKALVPKKKKLIPRK